MLRLILVPIAMGSLMLVSPVPLKAWQVIDSSLEALPLPAGSRAVSQEMPADLDGDGSVESVLLADHQLTIQSHGAVRWSSPDAWNVQQAIIADIDGDHAPEAILLVSRPFRAWPVDAWLPSGGRISGFHDERGFSSHIILIGWDGRRFTEKWAGSALAEPPASMAVVASKGSSRPSLLTLEKQYDDPADFPARTLKVWVWNGFGFSVVTSLDGAFTGMVVSQAAGEQFIILE